MFDILFKIFTSYLLFNIYNSVIKINYFNCKEDESIKKISKSVQIDGDLINNKKNICTQTDEEIITKKNQLDDTDELTGIPSISFINVGNYLYNSSNL